MSPPKIRKGKAFSLLFFYVNFAVFFFKFDYMRLYYMHQLSVAASEFIVSDVFEFFPKVFVNP